MSVWVRTIGERDDRVVAHDPQRPISVTAWQGDSRHVLYLQDRAGGENYHLFQVDLVGGSPREITPGENVRCSPLAIDDRFPTEALVLLNARSASLFDVHRVDFGSGESLIDTENPGDVMPGGWRADNSLVVRAAVAQLTDGSSCIRMRDDAHSEWRVLDEFSFADAERFAIFGGSYGGYAVLAALTHKPDAFTCGVDLCGPSNLNTFMAAIPSYWEPMRKLLAERMGEDPGFLDSQSPLFEASSIRVPLLIGQGANYPRLKQYESDQIVAALRSNDIPVHYVVFENEGHGFAEPPNNKRFTALTEAFLAGTLGRRLEPPHADEEIETFLR